jgi:AraC-like DNA-binding protein
MSTFHLSLDALEAGEAEESLRRISPNVELGRIADPRHRLRLHGEERFSLVRLEIAGEIWGRNEPDDTITIPYAVSGRMDWRVGDEAGSGNSPWLQGTETPTFSRAGPMVELATFLPKQPLVEFARAFYGEEHLQLRFDGAIPVSEADARYTATAMRLADHLAGTDAFESPLVRTSVYRQLAIAVLEGFRLRGERRERTLTAEGRQRRYRTAARFLDEFASLPITVEDAALAAGVSTRELRRLFLGHSPAGIGPTEHLRRTRLDAAHTDLVRGDPTRGDRVQDIAHRWGFASPSQFARLYRSRYGVTPKHVLDR